MKDSKFIELLNLYVDHQISAADAGLLESEIQKSPQRRKIYREYCQMQKACVILADNFRTEAPTSAKSVAFVSPPRRLAPLFYSIGGLAAAACLTFVVMNRTSNPRPLPVASAPSSAAVQIAAQPVPADLTAEPVVLPERVPLQPAFDGSLRNTAAMNFAATETTRVPLAWIKDVQLQRVPADQLRFETRQSLQPQELMFRNSPRTFQGQTEMTAWRFMK